MCIRIDIVSSYYLCVFFPPTDSLSLVLSFLLFFSCFFFWLFLNIVSFFFHRSISFILYSNKIYLYPFQLVVDFSYHDVFIVITYISYNSEPAYSFRSMYSHSTRYVIQSNRLVVARINDVRDFFSWQLFSSTY